MKTHQIITRTTNKQRENNQILMKIREVHGNIETTAFKQNAAIKNVLSG